MAWSYDVAVLGDTTAAERRNSVLMRIGDVDEPMAQLQDEEIDLFLANSGDSIIYAAIEAVLALIAKYSRRADTTAEGNSVSQSQIATAYRELLKTLRADRYAPFRAPCFSIASIA